MPAPSPVLLARFAAQLLTGPPAASPEDVVARLLAVQAQDARGFRLSVRARTTGLRATDVEAALTERRSLVLSWLNRGTLHLVPSEAYWWLHPLVAPRLRPGADRRLAQLGVTGAQVDRGVAVVREQVTQAARTREELRAALDAEGVPTAGQALVHLLFAASLRAGVVRGPVRGSHHCWVAADDWLGPPPEPLERPEALALLARRYLLGHGPADAADLAKWAGIGLGEARQGLQGIGNELVTRADGLVDLASCERAADVPPPRLLGAFDPLLHGWVSRDEVVGRHAGIVTSNGLFRPFALVGGRAVATWGLDGGRVTLRPLERLSRGDRQALEEEAADVLRYLGLAETPLVVEGQPPVQ